MLGDSRLFDAFSCDTPWPAYWIVMVRLILCPIRQPSSVRVGTPERFPLDATASTLELAREVVYHLPVPTHRHRAQHCELV